MQIAELLAETRARAGLSLRGLEERAGTSHSALAAYESASKLPSTRTLLRIIDAAGFAIDYELAVRCRGEAHTLARGEELRQVLLLAEQFPTRQKRDPGYPCFGEPVE